MPGVIMCMSVGGGCAAADTSLGGGVAAGRPDLHPHPGSRRDLLTLASGLGLPDDADASLRNARVAVAVRRSA